MCSLRVSKNGIEPEFWKKQDLGVLGREGEAAAASSHSTDATAATSMSNLGVITLQNR
jgi:hypothetical protein